MGGTISTASLTLFEILNECYVALGAGFWGILVLVNSGLKNEKYGGCLFLSAVTAGSLMYVLNVEEFQVPDRNKIIVITGCDSGLGFSMALHLHHKGFMVLAGCLDLHSNGARQLDCNGIRKFQLNVTNVDSVNKAVKFVSRVLDEEPGTELWAIVNNAGIMVFAEFEWQTDKLMFDQINVNLIGTMRVTKGFAPMLRQYKSRLINISSHCALESLPGLAVYGASKAALKGFTDSLRVEFCKYGVTVINFIPGSFPTQSNILAKQMDHVYEMRSAFTNEQEEFYGEYFQRYNAYLSAIANPNPARKLSNPDLYLHLEHALLAKHPRYSYKVEPLRYCIYHALFKVTPINVRDFLVEMFVNLPKYEAQDRDLWAWDKVRSRFQQPIEIGPSRYSELWAEQYLRPKYLRDSEMESGDFDRDDSREDPSLREQYNAMLTYDSRLSNNLLEDLAELDRGTSPEYAQPGRRRNTETTTTSPSFF